MFDILDYHYNKIRGIFSDDFLHILDGEFEFRIKRAIKVLHFSYLFGACKEAKYILKQNQNINLFEVIMSIYNKRRRIHQAKFFLLHCFENALRSTLAVQISNKYNTHADDWFLSHNSALAPLNHIKNMRCRTLVAENLNTFSIFDCFYLSDLENLSTIYWECIEHIFSSPKEYKSQPLPAYGKAHLKTKIGQIRLARNATFHNNPTKIKFIKDLEILLLRMDYNLQEAINSCDFRNDIKLQYKYI